MWVILGSCGTPPFSTCLGAVACQLYHSSKPVTRSHFPALFACAFLIEVVICHSSPTRTASISNQHISTYRIPLYKARVALSYYGVEGYISQHAPVSLAFYDRAECAKTCSPISLCPKAYHASCAVWCAVWGAFFICTFLDFSALSPICAGACGFMRFCAAALYSCRVRFCQAAVSLFYVRDYSRLFPPARFCWISSEKLLLWNLNNMHNI